MSNVAIIFGVLLGILGGVLFGLSETHSPTALIPAGFGLGLILCGVVARNDRVRMHAMHFAALIGLVGLVMPLVMVIRKLAAGGEFNPLSNGGQVAMAALCGVFLALCVKSFIDARRARKAREAEARA
jgi:peptidoglycan/LPS O-acetylase OafA/YrhL